MEKKIKCDVESCRNNNNECCCLDEIDICSCGCEDAADSEETMCSCFEKKD